MGKQQKRALAATNSARSINDISPQASVYVPILNNPRLLPRYLSADSLSEWHFSALISSAVESVTLPTRLRPYEGLDTWLPGEGGPHKIFHLQATIPFNKDSTSNSSMEYKKDASIAEGEENSDLDERLVRGFELDFTPPSAPSTRKIHVFSQVLVTRDSGRYSSEARRLSGSGFDRSKRRVTDSRPMVQRCGSIPFKT